MKIAIMPGHGGTDPGAVNKELGAMEADYNWTEAGLLKELLELRGHDILITRPRDKRIPLSRMQAAANSFEADLCFCLHHNAANGRARGWIIFCLERDMEFGEEVEEAFKKHVMISPLGGEGLRECDDNWTRVRNCISQCNMPTVLCESGFIDNREDCLWLINGGFSQVVDALVEAVCSHAQYIDRVDLIEETPTLTVAEELEYLALGLKKRTHEITDEMSSLARRMRDTESKVEG